MQRDGAWLIRDTNGVDDRRLGRVLAVRALGASWVVPDALSHMSETGVPVRVRSILAIVRPVIVDARGYPWSGIHVDRHY